MKTTEEIEAIYEANPSDWIAIWSTPKGWLNHGIWFKVNNPSFIEEYHYKLISIKHKEVLDAYLADNSVLILANGLNSQNMKVEWIEDNFIENYNPDLEYSLKGKEVSNDKDFEEQINGLTTIGLHERSLKEKEDEDNRLSSDIDTTMDNSVDSDNIVSKMTIPIIEVDEETDREIDEYFNSKADDSATKNHWYDDPANFPVRLVRDNEYCTTYRWVYNREEFVKSHRKGFKLVTEDKCTLVRSMF